MFTFLLHVIISLSQCSICLCLPLTLCLYLPPSRPPSLSFPLPLSFPPSLTHFFPLSPLLSRCLLPSLPLFPSLPPLSDCDVSWCNDPHDPTRPYRTVSPCVRVRPGEGPQLTYHFQMSGLTPHTTRPMYTSGLTGLSCRFWTSSQQPFSL